MSLNWLMNDKDLEHTYKLLCKKLHPDRNKDADTTHEFQELQQLYEKIKAYRATPQEIQLSVSLSELYHGSIKDIAVIDPTNPPQSEILPIVVPMGTMDKTVITVQTRYGGKINVHIKEVNDTKFIRDGYNLIVHLDITLVQALIADHITIGHFNRTLDVPTRIPHTSYRHIIQGMGMPIPNSADTAGNLYVVYNVIMPKNISSAFAHELMELSD